MGIIYKVTNKVNDKCYIGQSIRNEIPIHRHIKNAINNKKYIIAFPDGDEKVIQGINRFCREHGLSPGTLGMVVREKRRSHKGYKARYYKE